MFGEGIPEGGGSNGEGSVSPGSVLGFRDSEEVGIRGAEVTGRGVVVEQVSEVGGGLVVEGFVGEKEEFELNTLRDGEPVEVLEDRGDMIA